MGIGGKIRLNCPDCGGERWHIFGLSVLGTSWRECEECGRYCELKNGHY